MALLTLSPAAGTQPDLVSRLKSVLPTGWFADSTPVLDGVLNGLAAGWAGVFGLLGYVQMQTRIATASDTFLDLVAADFFAGRITRSAGEPDESLRARIDRELLRERATRGARRGCKIPAPMGSQARWLMAWSAAMAVLLCLSSVLFALTARLGAVLRTAMAMAAGSAGMESAAPSM
jgi:hypothetical protein